MDPKKSDNFLCEKCDYKCSKQSQWERHINTRKHKNVDKMLSNVDILGPKKIHTCYCGKIYSHRQSLSIHKKSCNKYNINENVENFDKKDELINYLIKENQEFKNLILEIVKKDTITNNNITNTNSNNKTFNLQFFLNETCKDAMNIMDFVDSIKIQLSDLEKVGKIGFVEGISKIIVQNLNSLDETKRPVHCTDSKREVMYVKDEDKWEKENEEKVKLRKAIKKVAHKNLKMLSEYRTKNPDCLKSTSKVSDHYNKLVFEVLGGKGNNDLEKEDKIIKNIAKEVIIDK
jgi:hypothetical protein